jgi:ethanolamine utilization cobalamin adenosyltransferase
MLAPEIKEVVVPSGTVVTPGARDIIKKKNLKLMKIPTTH